MTITVSGCYLNADISSLSPTGSSESREIPNLKLDSSVASEFVSGSDQYITTPIRKFKINSSVGSFQREIKVKTPVGFTIYSSVQGAFISMQGAR